MRISGIGSLLLAALTGALLLSELAAAVVIPTSEGNGADAYLSNDSNRGPAVMHGEKVHLEIRQISGSRLRLLYLRFDLAGVAGNLSGATITLNGTTINEDRPISFYGLEEGPAAGAGENWNMSTISYSNASGLDSASPLGILAFTADATSSALASTSGSAVGETVG